jgi:enoyl-CoA hydratase/carnithine racemase
VTRLFVDYDKVDHIVTITLNRPERMNSLSAELLRDLDSAWTAFFADDDAFVAIYTGTGRAFCAGKDLKEAAEAAARGVILPASPRLAFNTPEQAKPVICAVNGYAMGGGFLDVLKCDLRVAADSAEFQLAEVPRGVLPGPILEGLAGSLPDCLTTELALGGRITARRAYEMGLLNRVVPDGQLMSIARDYASRIARLPPLTVRLTVEALRRGRLTTAPVVDPAWRSAADKALANSSDTKEAILAFTEKRNPVYTGK